MAEVDLRPGVTAAAALAVLASSPASLAPAPAQLCRSCPASMHARMRAARAAVRGLPLKLAADFSRRRGPSSTSPAWAPGTAGP
jgi:hypothetical protein